MSTRSAIIMKNEFDESYSGIYCHFDGYKNGVGIELFDNYQDLNKVKDLIALGDISSLGDSIKSTVAYHRDRDEELSISHGYSVKQVANQIGHNGYVYLYKDNKWYINDVILDFEDI